MKNTIHKTFELNEPIDKVWNALSNPYEIVPCVPGASLTEQVDDRNYKGLVALKFGPVKAKYAGKIHFEELDATTRKMRLKGSGVDTKGKGSADMVMDVSLKEKEEVTEVMSSMEINLTGKLAQFGSRLITEVTDVIFDQFVDNFKHQLKSEASKVETIPSKGISNDSPAKKTTGEVLDPKINKGSSINTFALIWSIIKRMFSGIFGRKKE